MPKSLKNTPEMPQKLASFLEKLAKTGNLRASSPGLLADVLGDLQAWATEAMLVEAGQGAVFSRLRVPQKIEALVLARLQASAAYKKGFAEVYRALKSPLYAPLNLKLLYRTVDDIWHAAGDEATDYNHYTKRFLLAGVYIRTIDAWISDDSPGMVATKAALTAGLERAAGIGKIARSFKSRFAA